MRLNAKRILGVNEHLLHRIDKRGGRNGRARDGIHIAAQRIRIGSDCDELLLESIIANAAAQTLRFLKGTDVGLRHITINAHTEGDRNLSAIALRVRRERIALHIAVSILAGENLVQHAVVGKTFIFDLLIFAAGQDRFQSRHLRRKLLLLDRVLGHFVCHSEQHGGNKRKDEQTERKLHNITHYFLTSPKLL